MTLRHLFLVLASFFLFTNSSQAQTSDNPWMAGVSGIFLDYQGLMTGDLTQYKTFDPGIQFGAHAYVNNLMNISIQSAFVPESLYPMMTEDGLTYVGTSLVDANGIVTFKSNGTIFSEDAIFAPYFSTGIGINSANNVVRPYIPAALGLRLRLSSTFSLQFETMYKQRLGQGSFQHIAHTAGFVFALPTQKKPEPKMTVKKQNQRPALANNDVADRDGDGIADKDDVCPDVKGLAMYLGCPAEEKKETVPADKPSSPTQIGLAINDANDENVQIADMGEARLSDLNVADNPINNEQAYNVNQAFNEIDSEDLEYLAQAMDNVYFEFGSNELTANSYFVLDTVAQILDKYPDYNLHVLGHTDNTGNYRQNQILSVQRAFSVKYYLVNEKGIRLARIASEGYNSSAPLADNGTEAGRAKNRRVEFQLVRAGKTPEYPN